jgi:hypothetical protein
MLRSIWDTVFGLLVDDGSLAIGIVIALVIAWVAVQSIGDATGWLLLALLVILVVGNLFAAGRKTRARISA